MVAARDPRVYMSKHQKTVTTNPDTTASESLTIKPRSLHRSSFIFLSHDCRFAHDPQMICHVRVVSESTRFTDIHSAF